MIASELAAMEIGPSGATMMVLIMCDPLIMMFWSHIGAVMPQALRTVLRRGMNVPCSPLIFNSLERLRIYQITNIEVTTCAAPVPRAAPATPISQM